MEQPLDFKFELEYMGIKTALISNPLEWKQYSTEWTRHKTYHGFFRGWIESLTFVNEGADILRKAYDVRGVEADVVLRVYRLDRSSYQYNLDFVGSIDFSSMEYTIKDGGINVSIKQGGVMQLLEAYSDVEYDIPVNTSRTVAIEANSIMFYENATLMVMPNPYHMVVMLGNGTPLPTIFIESSNFTRDYEFPTRSDLSEDMDPENPLFYTPSFYKRSDAQSQMRITTQISQSAYDPIILDLLDLDIVHTNSRRFEIYLVWYDGEHTTSEEYHIGYSDTIVQADLEYTSPFYRMKFNIDGTTILTKPGRYFISMRHYEMRNGAWTRVGANYRIQSGAFYHEYQTYSPGFSFHAMPLLETTDLLLKRMGIDTGISSSLFTNTTASKLWVTSGNAIRGFDDAMIRIKFSDLFKSIESIYNVGLGIRQEQVYIEEKGHFFDASRGILKIANVKDVSIEPDTGKMFTGINIGYEDQTYDEINGIDEFNTELSFKMPLTKIGDKDGEIEDLVSKIRADCYGIVYTWFKRATKKSTDYDTDNKTFFVVVNDANGMNVGVDKSIEVLDGSLSPQGVFNVAISPKHNLRRWFSYLKSICDKQLDKMIEFTSTAKPRSSLVSKDVDGTIVTEWADTLVGSIPDRMFSPNILKFTTPVPYDLPFILGSSPTGYIEVLLQNGLSLKGFIEEISENPTARNEQDWTLLLHPDTPDNLCELLNIN